MNTHKVTTISQSLKDLLRGMLAHDNAKRMSLDQVLDSPWFNQMRNALVNDPEVLETTRKSLTSKLGYVTNLTKVKIPLIKEEPQPVLEET